MRRLKTGAGRTRVFREYLNGQEFPVLEQLSMPFWITSSGEFSILYIVEDPFGRTCSFADPAITFSVSHDYPAIDRTRSSSYRIYLTGPDPVKRSQALQELPHGTG